MTDKDPKANRAAAAKEAAEPTFEVCLDRLEKIVQELEHGDQPLERTLELFEEGMKLSANCRRKLEEAENRVEILLKKGDGKITAEPFRLGQSNDEQPS
jgi:exodeoxyribonuclease VII small subunit